MLESDGDDGFEKAKAITTLDEYDFDIDTLTRTNHRLSAAQFNNVSELLSQAVSDPEKTTARLHDDINRFKYLLAPIRLLPIEILVQIFLYTAVHEPQACIPLLNQAPISTSQVCSAWRSASFLCSTLWSKLSVSFDKYKTTSNANIELMNFWYSRADARPLSFLLTCRSNRIVKEITAALVPFSHRFSHLCFDVDHLEDLKEFLSQRNTVLTWLNKLKIYIKYAPTELYTVNLFRCAPALRDVTFNIRSDMLAIPSSFGFPWAQLTHLNLLHRITPHAFTHIILQCRQLVHASFSVNIQQRSLLSPPAEQSQDLVVLAYLVKLRLRIYGSGRHYNIVQNTMAHLVFPSMKNFELYGVGAEFSVSLIFPSLHTHNINIYAASAILLTRLVLVSIYCYDGSEFASMLRACTALETLAIQATEDYIEILAVLSDPIGNIPPPSLPSLTSFVLVIEVSGSLSLPTKLNRLVRAWMSNPARCRPFGACTIYALEEIYDTGITEEILGEIRVLLGPWREIDEPGGCVAIAHSGMVLRTRHVSAGFTLTGQDDNWLGFDWPKE
ncbi:hypothetical protein H0H81_003115 [Sphagnurus paluster]|uniref:F-box domain-containing protein n=1 Tax=Sphagnurus paluster TaxID=117069 RepID=A0A9P7GSZ9_9AGAR|nr:hypothetical protein H0H81_003115 [Sphagnurus paluster]